MDRTARAQLWDRRGRPFDGQVLHEGGGLVTIRLESPIRFRLGIGDHLRWTTEACPSGLRGSIASTYECGAALHLVVTMEARTPARPAPRPSAAAAASSSAGQPARELSHRLVAGRPRANIIAGGEVAAGEVRSLIDETLVVYLARSSRELLKSGASVKASIELVGQDRRLHFWARVSRLDLLNHGALARLELDATSPAFDEELGMLARSFGLGVARTNARGESKSARAAVDSHAAP
jgi:hypothetical protein